jgi:hypothetical protein
VFYDVFVASFHLFWGSQNRGRFWTVVSCTVPCRPRVSTSCGVISSNVRNIL